ncbi:MAG: ferrous iron transport protein A [Ruminococcus sp.]|nr:ferrous iron transport protein A [Ruminococcus sp.]
MMPINLSEPEKEVVIKKIGGSPEVRKHLETLGFTVGEKVSLVSILSGSVIIKVKESRIAVGEELARKIMV